MLTSHKVIHTLKKYHKLDSFGKKRSYQYHELIYTTQSSLLSRLLASAIPLSSTLSFVTKLLSDICRVIESIIESIYYRELSIGNVQTLGVDFAEYIRHLLGIIFGFPLAWISPKYAADTFLTIPANISTPFLSKEDGARLYSMGHLLDQFLTKYKIDYRICCGTALGARREKGIIPNDDDMDIMIYPNSTKALQALIENGIFTNETGIIIKTQPFTGGWQCFYEESPKGTKGTPTENVGNPFIDIFPGVYRTKGNEKIITYGEDKMYYQSRGDYFTKDEWASPVTR